MNATEQKLRQAIGYLIQDNTKTMEQLRQARQYAAELETLLDCYAPKWREEGEQEAEQAE